MNIRIATTDAEVSACYPVMQELRPHIGEEQFLPRVRNQENAGYRLAYVHEQESVVAVAGFRVGKNLAWGDFLYVDDLVTHSGHRSKGYGAKLFSWLQEQAAKMGCQQIHLDSGAQRKDAHRFYEREGMLLASFHFVENIGGNKALPQDAPQSACP
jgi:GNAT superfamily N-acetyltransferase